jgi:processive 1,2-diacylglycerol beta-glucosyltransferase
MAKVLLLTAGYGEGHNAAARGLHAAFTEAGADSQIVDLFALTGGAVYEQSRRGYLELINRAPKVWAAVYSLIDQLPLVSLTMPLLGKMQRALSEIITREQPEAILSVYPIYGYLLDRLYPAGQSRPFSFHTVVTDSITINRVWHRCASDTFLVPNEDTARVMSQAGVAEAKLRVLGFPVPPIFANDRPARLAPSQGNPGRVLYMINAGKEQAPAILARLLKVRDVEFTVTAGRDEALRQRLEQVAREAGRAVEILGWTDQMPEMVMSHHLLIGKAGGATVQEAIAACTPMLITQVVPGQEEGNARLLLENGCGALCPTPDALASTIERVFSDSAVEWRVWEQNTRKLSRPNAAREIAKLVLDEAAKPASRSPS